MNKTLLKMNFKMNRGVWLIFLAILVMYVSMIESIYDPNNIDVFAQMLVMFPSKLMDALHFSITDYSLVGFISGYLYGFIMVIFPMIYIIIVGNRLIASFVDSGSMAYILSTPNTRRKIAITQAFYLFISVTLLIITISLLAVAISLLMFPGLFDFQKFFYINLGLIGYNFLISSIVFLSSSIFNETRFSLAFGAGIPIGFFVINMLAGASPDFDFVKYFTALTLYDANEWILGGSIILVNSLIFLILGTLFYGLAVYLFSKKDLPL